MNESLLHKIKQLHESYKSALADGRTAEAESFAAKVTDWLGKHNLDISDVEGFEKKSREPITELAGDELIPYNSVPSDGQWEINLLDTLAHHNFCYLLYYSGIRRATLIGTRSNIEVVKYLYSVMRDMIKRLAGQAYTDEVNRARRESAVWCEDNKDAVVKIVRQYGFRHEDVVGNVIKLDTKDGVTFCPHLFAVKDPSKTGQITYRSVFVPQFLKGAAEGVETKLAEGKKLLPSKMTDLMIVNNNAIIKYKEIYHTKVKHVASKQVNKTDAFQLGVEEGKKIKVNKAIEDGEEDDIKLLN